MADTGMADNTTGPMLPTASDIAQGLGRMFYLADPAVTSFPDLDSIPHPGYVQQAMPYFFGMILLEWTILILKGHRPRLNDGLMSVTHGLIMNLMELIVSGTLFASYLYIYNNHRIYQLPWDSTFTWVVAAIGIDFFYYWVHRAAHEVNVLWAAHQVHHSSEEYNLTTALRQSAFQAFGSFPFYLPMAFFVPPSHAVVHKELNLLYQFWIHTELVDHLGPLEYILNTASHHRVHHGANRYCLDKNYAGVLIIWDRMFGTFEAERKDVKIVYGLVDQPQFFNPIKHQVFYYQKVVEKALSMPTWTEFLYAFVKGPGWFPGTDRLGDISFVPEEPVRDVYNPHTSPLLHLYTLTHFIVSLLAADTLARTMTGPGYLTGLVVILYLLWSLTALGILYDGSAWAWLGELARCTVSLAYLGPLAALVAAPPSVLLVIFAGSAVLATGCLLRVLVSNTKMLKVE